MSEPGTEMVLRRRRGGSLLIVLVDLLRDARRTRNITIAALIALTVLAVLAGATTQTAVPFLVYGGL